MPGDVDHISVGIPDPDPESTAGGVGVPVPGLEIAPGAGCIPVPGFEIAPGAEGSPGLGPDKIRAGGNHVLGFDKFLGVGSNHGPGPDNLVAVGSHFPDPERGQGDAQPREASEGELSQMSDHLPCHHIAGPHVGRWPVPVFGLAEQQHQHLPRSSLIGLRPPQQLTICEGNSRRCAALFLHEGPHHRSSTVGYHGDVEGRPSTPQLPGKNAGPNPGYPEPFGPG